LLEPAHRVKKIIAAVVIAGIAHVDNHRHPHVDMPRDWKLQLKTGRHHANHRNLMRVERQTLVYDARVRTELPLPQFMTDNYRERASGCFCFRRKRSPEHRLYAEHLEEIGGDDTTLNSLRLANTG